MKLTKLIPYKDYPSYRDWRGNSFYNYEEVEKVYTENQQIATDNAMITQENSRIVAETLLALKDIGVSSKSDVKRGLTLEQWIRNECRHYLGGAYNASSYKSSYERIMKSRVDAEKQKADKQRADEAAAERLKAERQLGVLAAKYDLVIDADYDTIKSDILRRNKYLDLADAMSHNRSDWSDGYDITKCALERFHADCEFDNSLKSELWGVIHNSYEDGYIDGRVFRDCDNNYNALFERVKAADPGLYEDYKTVIDIGYKIDRR